MFSKNNTCSELQKKYEEWRKTMKKVKKSKNKYMYKNIMPKEPMNRWMRADYSSEKIKFAGFCARIVRDSFNQLVKGPSLATLFRITVN